MRPIRPIQTIALLLFLAFTLSSGLPLNAQTDASYPAATTWQPLRLQFEEVPDALVLEQLAQQGLQLLHYEDSLIYTFAAPTNLINTGLRSNRWTILSPQKNQLSEQLDQQLARVQPAEAEALIPITLLLYRQATDAEWRVLRQHLEEAELSSSGRLLTGRARAAAINTLRQHPLIHRIENTVEEMEPLIAESRAMHKVNLLHAEEYGLSGLGQTIGIGDAGMLSNHIDFADRLITKTDFLTNGFHPEHVAGILAGAGNLDPNSKGMAPASQLIVERFHNIIKQTPAHIKNYGMSLTNNSYGPSFSCDRNGASNLLTNELDWQAFNHPQLLHVFAAGNSGDQQCKPYTNGFGSILAYYPVAKNVLTVGNVDLNRQLAYNSSKGPTVDGRIKPEIAARGVLVRSAAHDADYQLLSGTSMAAPAVSGVVALLQERYAQRFPDQAAPAALLKALLCNSADDAGLPGPDFSFGFGILNAYKALKALEEDRYQTGNIAHAQRSLHTLDVPADTRQLKVLLHWVDPEASLNASKDLVNDLDLSLLGPQSRRFLPLVPDPAVSQLERPARQQVDRLNNIEQIIIDNPAAGRYSLQVDGHLVPMGPQAYVLTYELYTEELVLTYPQGGEQLLPGADILLSWQAEPTNTHRFSLEYSTDGGQSWSLIADQLSAEQRDYRWTLPEAYAPNTIFRVSKEGTGQRDFSRKAVAIVPTVEEWSVDGACGGGVEVWCTPVPQAVGYELWLLQGKEMVPVYYSTSPVMQYQGNLEAGKEYWMALRVKTAGGQYSQRSLAQRVVATPFSSITPVLNIIRPVTCYGSEDGVVEVVIEEQGDYDFFWDNGTTGALAETLAAGEHWVTITDERGCETSVSVVLLAPEALTAQVFSHPATSEDANGGASVNLSGGTPPYQYSWDVDGGLNAPVISQMEAGDYEVTITDSNGCSLTQSVEIDLVSSSEPEPASLSGFKLFPNPTPDILIAELQLAEAASIEMVLFDPLGRQLRYQFYELATSIREEWNLEQLEAGTYWLQLRINDERMTQRVVLIK